MPRRRRSETLETLTMENTLVPEDTNEVANELVSDPSEALPEEVNETTVEVLATPEETAESPEPLYFTLPPKAHSRKTSRVVRNKNTLKFVR